MNGKICNYCGKVFDEWDVREDFTIHKSPLGYGTVHDGDELRLHLCCDCMEKIIAACVVSPIVENN